MPIPRKVAQPASDVEDEYLIANWETHTIHELAKELGGDWSDNRVRDRGRKLNLSPRREIALKITRKLEADRIARRRAVKPLPELQPQTTGQGWSDGWRIEGPSTARLMGRR